MPSRNKSTQAIARLQPETPISNDAGLLELQEQAAEYVHEAKRRDPSEPDELVSSVLDAVARDYFRYAIDKQRKRTRRALPVLLVLYAMALFAAPAMAGDGLRWRLERDRSHQDRKLSADRQLSIGRGRWQRVHSPPTCQAASDEMHRQGFAPGRACQWAAKRQCRFGKWNAASAGMPCSGRWSATKQ